MVPARAFFPILSVMLGLALSACALGALELAARLLGVQPRTAASLGRTFPQGQVVTYDPGELGRIPEFPAAKAVNPRPEPLRIEPLDTSNVYTGMIDKSAPYHRLAPDRRNRSVAKRMNGETVFDVRFSTDSHRRRIVPDQAGSARGSRAILFLGCSMIFGTGVNDDETLPYYVSRMVPDARAYNYGAPSYSPAASWVDLSSRDLSAEIPEVSVTAFFFYFDNHMARGEGSLLVRGVWGWWLPSVERGEDGALAHRGTFEEAQPLITFFYRTLAKSRLFGLIDRDLPWRMTEHHIENTVALIAGIRDELARKVKLRDFYLVAHPRRSESISRLAPALHRAGIRTIDYSRWQIDRLTALPTRIPYDGHPSPEGNRLFAEILADTAWAELGLPRPDGALAKRLSNRPSDGIQLLSH